MIATITISCEKSSEEIFSPPTAPTVDAKLISASMIYHQAAYPYYKIDIKYTVNANYFVDTAYMKCGAKWKMVSKYNNMPIIDDQDNHIGTAHSSNYEWPFTLSFGTEPRQFPDCYPGNVRFEIHTYVAMIHEIWSDTIFANPIIVDF